MSGNDGWAAAQADVRTRLVRAAEGLLASSIDGQISTREICSGAGVTAPTLYHHFKDKNALLDAVVLEGFNIYLVQKRSVMLHDDAIEEFRQGWDMHVTFGCQHPAHYRLMFGNPRTGHAPPAALLAREILARTVTDWGREGRLLVPIDAATATMTAAAVGVTLQLIAMRADSTNPISANVRDAISRALFGPPTADNKLATGVARPARQLLDALPPGPLAPLRSTETALLREWLSVISDASETKEETS